MSNQLHKQVAEEFYRRHFDQLARDFVGFGGMITEKQVGRELSIVATRHMIPATHGVQETNPPDSVVPQAVPASQGPLVMTAAQIESMEQKQCRTILRQLHLPSSGNADVVRK